MRNSPSAITVFNRFPENIVLKRFATQCSIQMFDTLQSLFHFRNWHHWFVGTDCNKRAGGICFSPLEQLIVSDARLVGYQGNCLTTCYISWTKANFPEGLPSELIAVDMSAFLIPSFRNTQVLLLRGKLQIQRYLSCKSSRFIIIRRTITIRYLNGLSSRVSFA